MRYGETSIYSHLVRECGYYLNTHEKDLANQNNDGVVVGILWDVVVAKDVLLDDWEEDVHKIV